MARPVSIFIVLFGVVVAGIYTLGISGPLVLDDWPNLSVLQRLTDRADWHTAILSSVSGSLGRPVSMATFYIEYLIFGFNTAVFKSTNIFLHLCCGSLVFLLAKRLYSYSIDEGRAAVLAACCAALWLASPLFSSTVLYIIQRMAILSTLFTLLALLAYERFRYWLANNSIHYGWLALSALSALLGLLSKESAALIPLFILVMEAYFLARPCNRRCNVIRVLLVTSCVSAILSAIAYLIMRPERFLNYATRNFNAYERLLTESRIMWDYVGAILLPRSNSFGLFHDDIIVSTSLFSPSTTIITLVLWGAVLAGLVWTLLRGRYANVGFVKPLAGGVAFFLAGHALESTIFNLELYFEHRNYLPAFGLYFALVLASYQLIFIRLQLKKLAVAAFSAYCAVFLLALVQRSITWSDIVPLTYVSLMAHPDSPRGNAEAALLDARLGDFDAAIAKLEHALTLPSSAKMGLHTQLVYTYCKFNVPGFPVEKISEVRSLPMDGTAYTSSAFDALNEHVRTVGCSSVPYREFIIAMYDRFLLFYEGPELEAKPGLLHTSASLQMRLMEALNFLALTDRTLVLAENLNKHGIDHMGINLLTAVALIDRGRMDEAGTLLRYIRSQPDIPLDFEKNNLRVVEKMLTDRVRNSEGATHM